MHNSPGNDTGRSVRFPKHGAEKPGIPWQLVIVITVIAGGVMAVVLDVGGVL